jgi:hypothetical protein
MADKLQIGEGWVLVETGGKVLFGRVVELPAELEEDEATKTSEEPGTPAESSEDVEDTGGLFLSPCYEEYRAATQQGIVKNLVPYALLAHTTRVLVTQPTVIVEVADMSPGDVADYRKLVQSAEDTKLQSRSRQSGIALVAPARA